MGWSCRVEAGVVLDAWMDACVKATGTSNGYRLNGTDYFWETSRTEHRDGAITGSIQRTVRVEGDRKWCRKAGSFRIEGDGTVTRGPAMLKAAAKATETRANIARRLSHAREVYGRGGEPDRVGRVLPHD